MADVIVLSRDATMEFLDLGIIDGDINGSGHFIFTTQGGGTVDLGQLDHGLLTGLADDDHSQYAKADGSRGSFATTTQGTKADNARPNVKSVTDFDGGADSNTYIIETFRVTIDGTDAGDWPDRVRKFIRNGSGSYRYVWYENEYFEPRFIPARHDTVATRWFVIDSSSLTDGTARNANVPIFELMDDRSNRKSLWAIMPSGERAFHNTAKDTYIREARLLLLADGDSVPTGTPAGTVIVRYTP